MNPKKLASEKEQAGKRFTSNFKINDYGNIYR